MSSSYFINTPLRKFQNPQNRRFRQFFKQNDFKASMFRSRTHQDQFLTKSIHKKLYDAKPTLPKPKVSYNYNSTGKLIDRIQAKLHNLKQSRHKSNSPVFLIGSKQSYLINSNKYFDSPRSQPQKYLVTLERLNKKVNLKEEIAKSIGKLSRVSKKLYDQRKPEQGPLFRNQIKSGLKESVKVPKYNGSRNYFQNVRQAGKLKKLSEYNNNPYGLLRTKNKY